MNNITRKITAIGLMLMILIGLSMSLGQDYAMAFPPKDMPEECKLNTDSKGGGRTQVLKMLQPYNTPGTMGDMMYTLISKFNGYFGNIGSSTLPTIYGKFDPNYWQQQISPAAIEQIAAAETAGFAKSTNPCEKFMGGSFSQKDRQTFLKCYKDGYQDPGAFAICGLYMWDKKFPKKDFTD